jgi:hypothetical protein
MQALMRMESSSTRTYRELCIGGREQHTMSPARGDVLVVIVVEVAERVFLEGKTVLRVIQFDV